MIHGERIRQARQIRLLTQKELADRLQISQSTIAHIEAGRLAPADDTLHAIAAETGFPASFFDQPLEEDVPLGSLLFRARASASAHAETLGHRYAQMGYRLITKLLEETKPIPLVLPRLDITNPRMAARITRSSLNLPANRPLDNLINSLEKAGVVVFALPIELLKIDAFSFWASHTVPVVVLSCTGEQDGARLRYSVAHEVGHLVMHHSMDGDIPRLETEANAFAAELLLPEEGVREDVQLPATISSLAQLKPRWKVSIQALVMRMHDLEIITDRQKKYLFQQLTTKGWRRREPPNLDVRVERPRTLTVLAELHHGSPIDFEALARRANFLPGLVRQFVEAQSGKLGSVALQP